MNGRVDPFSIPSSRDGRKGFTLIELLVVIAIIAVLAALVFPSAKNMIASGQSAKAAGNLRGIGSLLASYTADNNNCLPVLIRWGNEDKTWLQRVLSESAGLPVKPANGLERRLADLFYDPALEDFFARRSYRTQGSPSCVSVTSRKPRIVIRDDGLVSAEIPVWMAALTLASAKIPSGVPCKGSWYIQGKEWAAAGNAEAMPDARHGGKALCLFADGHTEALDTTKMSAAERRQYFLRDTN